MARISKCSLVFLFACTSPPMGDGGDGSTDLDGGEALTPADAAPISVDASPPSDFGPAIVFDDIHIAGLFEDPHAFSLLGELVNPYLASAVSDGTILFGFEARDLADPSGQSTEDITVGLYGFSDSDDDASDNFDPDHPETYFPGFGSMFRGDPLLLLDSATTDDGFLEATGLDVVDLMDLIPISIYSPTLSGWLSPTSDNTGIRTFSDGRLEGAVPALLLAASPNLTGDLCPGDTMLDVMVTGCGTGFSLQPDVDLDGDGLERYYDTHGDGEGTPKDGKIDKCVDGDGEEVLGTSCIYDLAMLDAYRIVFAVHGVRAVLAN